MKLEDAFLYLELDGSAGAGDAAALCAAAIDGGVDVVDVDGARMEDGALRELAAACHGEEALLVLRNAADRVAAAEADGLRLAAGGDDLGLARVTLGEGRFIGMTTEDLNQARLSLEIGADYLVHRAGTDCAGDFSALRFEARVPLFAAGFDGVEEARRLTDAGVFRLCLTAGSGDAAALREKAASYARLLGRCV